MKQTTLGVWLRFLLTMPLDLLATRSRVTTREKTVLLVHLHHIGDYVLLRNFIRIMQLHGLYSNYRFTLCANEEIRPLVESFDRDCFSDCIWLNRNKLLNDLWYRFRMLRMIRRRGFAVALQPAFSREFYFGDAVVHATRAIERIGSHGGGSNVLPWQKRRADSFYTRLIPGCSSTMFEFLRNREFFEQLLGEEIPLTKPVLDIDNVALPQAIGRKYAIVFPGASVPSKRWTPEGFAQVARHLATSHRLTVVLAGAPSENDLAARVAELAPEIDLINLAGRTTLAQLAGYLAGAELLVANDTVAVHLAVAVSTPVVYLLTGAHYGRFGPYPVEVFAGTKALYPKGIDFNEASEILAKRFERSPDLDITSISAEDVISAVDHLLL